ncbi:MAG: hypothetical protein K2M67_08775 [Muribaculaceae bacterium]|nr:hypothetical protein [Muribaculaceae bacterium]
MTKNEIIDKVAALVADYLECDQAWGDSPMIEIDPSDFSMRITEEEERPELDYVDMMDLLQMSVTDPGQWEADEEAIAYLADSYL